MKILVENSTWNNVGDGFYQTCLYSIVKRLFPEAHVAMSEGPIKRAFRPRSFFQRNAFDIRPYQSADLHIFSGPILNDSFIDDYGTLIRQLKMRGEEYALLSVYSNASPRTRDELASFMAEYPPVAFSSRTSDTFETFRDVAVEPFNGICAAFFVSKVLPVAELDESFKYVVYSFYSTFEPIIKLHTDHKGGINPKETELAAEDSSYWRVKRHIEWARRHPRDSSGFRIIRPHHDIGYKFSHLNFAKPNSFLSYNPLTYLSLYSRSRLTISDRVHSCVAALSFGNPAILYGDWDRAALFAAAEVEATKINDRAVLLLPPNKTLLETRLDGFQSWLKGRILNARFTSATSRVHS